MNGIDRLEKQLCDALRRHLANGAPVRLPEAGRLLWRAFIDLDSTRSMHAAGPNPITYTEIEAWARINRYPLASHHVRVIKALDAVLIEHVNHKAGTGGEGGIEGRSAHALSPTLFDAAAG